MAEQNNQNAAGQENLSQLLQIRRDKLKELQESGSDPFQITRYVTDNDSANIKANFDALEGQAVSIAGRLMSKRGMGKVSFCDLQDKSGRIQLYARKDEMDEAEYNLIRFPQRGVCLFKCGNERYLLEVHAPAYKEALFGAAGGR